ncbi:efflux RND transporter permease subunit [Idiomarina sp. HP20-50]|uniref:efflux RND transporter permease subunit n=1 Tax=Idiomarina sp. HP20-50 TaxID=3070813 RepID=UPI00294B8E71|nr:MMPL family transporter [Idiomarina sp. HP20-50]MDV6316361.1 MMPL family transporter [Idiomarina sp. HP20-50]
MIDVIMKLATGYRKSVFWLLTLITIAITAFIPSITIDTDPENMLPDNNPQRLFHNQVKQTFSMHDMIVVGVVNNNGVYNKQTLTDLHTLSNYAESLDGVISDDLMSLANVDNITQKSPGTIRFEWMMKQPPENDAEAQYIKQQVEDLPLLYNTIVAGDAKAAAIYVPIRDKNQSYALAEKLREKTETLKGQDEWYITGLPVAEDQFGSEMFVQMGISAPIAGLVIFALLWFFFRNVRFISAAMIVAVATVLITMGSLIALGFTVHIMSSMIAIFLMPIAVVDSVHIMSEFSDRYKQNGNAKDTIKAVLSHLFKPMLFTSITSAVGFYSLMLTPIPPVQVFGAFVGSGILLAFVITVLFVPAYISALKPTTLEGFSQLTHDEHKTGWLQKMGDLAARHAKLWIAFFLVILVFSWYGIQQITINDNPVRWFKPGHEIRVADRVLNKHFAGTYNAYMVFKSTLDVDSKARDAVQNTLNSPVLSGHSRQVLNELLAKQDVRFNQWIIAVDDLLFSVDANELKPLESLMTELEQLNSKSKVFQSPELLSYMSELQRYLQTTGLVGKSNSLTDVVKTVNRELRSGREKDYELPDNANGVAQTLLQYQSSHRPQDLWHFVTPDYQQSLVWLQLTSGDNQHVTEVVNTVDSYLAKHPLPDNIEMDWAGKAYLNVVWQEAMVEGMLDSLISAFIAVFIMMVLLFRSVIFGVLAMLPLSLTIAFIYGLIGWVGKDYDMPIAVLSSLTLGLSVDFAIHFIERTRATFQQTGNWKDTLVILFDEPARAISRNAIVIAIGFTPLLFAPLVPYITVGLFLASIMAISAIVTLIMLPAVMTTFSRLIFRGGQS